MSVLAVYPAAVPESIAWPEPVESLSRHIGRLGARVAGARRGDVSLADRLFMAALVAMPREERYGAVSWLASLLGVSRQMVYDVAQGVHQQVRASGAGGMEGEPDDAVVAEFGLERAVLTLLLPGGVTLRPMRHCLHELAGKQPSVGWLSELLTACGQRAGEVLDAADWSAVDPFIATRDEKFFDDRAYLMTVDPESLAIVSGHVEDGVDRDRWAVSLGLDQMKTGHSIIGLAEDAATWYPGSASDASAMLGTPYLAPVQKDHFHVLRQATQALLRSERRALAELRRAERKATTDPSGLLRIRDFKGWESTRSDAEHAVARAQDLHFWVHSVADALELVEPGTGAVRDSGTASWYLRQIVQGLRSLDDPEARKLASYIGRQQHQLFTFLDWIEPVLDDWRQDAANHFGDPEVARYFERSVARAWRLRRAAASGRRRQRRAAERAEAMVAGMCRNDPTASRLAFGLATLLDSAVRGTSSAETINSILQRYLAARKGFRERVTAQGYLNLLMLWHGMRRFDRGKRRGHSPFELAGVRILDPDGIPTDDWRAALGYPAAA